jgi:uncharacterized protein
VTLATGRRIGTVRSVHRYPAKSMAGEVLTSARIDAAGLVGDRAFAVVDARDGRVVSVDSAPELLFLAARYRPGTSGADRRHDLEILVPSLPGPVSGDDVDEALSAWLGRAVHLFHRDDVSADRPTFFDYGFELSADAPTFGDVPRVVHVVSGTALDWFTAHGSEADTRRTRANLVVDLDGPTVLDEELLGRRLHVGDAVITLDEPTERCRLVEVAQPGLPDRTGLLDALNRELAGNLGIYARVATAGTVRPGDEVRAAGADA